jgi:hypothetical protein
MKRHQKQRGGPRPGSGRKPLPDKRVALTIYVKRSALDALGKEAARKIAIEAIQSNV